MSSFAPLRMTSDLTVIVPSEGQAESARVSIEESLLTTEVTENTENLNGWFVNLRVLCDLCG